MSNDGSGRQKTVQPSLSSPEEQRLPITIGKCEQNVAMEEILDYLILSFFFISLDKASLWIMIVMVL